MESSHFRGKLLVELTRSKNKDALESFDLSDDRNKHNSELPNHRPKRGRKRIFPNQKTKKQTSCNS